MLMRPKALGLLLVLALTGTACAGDVLRFQDAAVGPDGVTIVAGRSVPGQARGIAPIGDPAGATASPSDSAAVSDTAVPIATAAGTPASPGAPTVTVTSGQAARLSGQNALGAATTRTAAGNNQSAPPPTGGATGTGPGSQSSSPTAGGGAGASPTPTPVTPPSGGTTVGVTKDSVTVGLFYPKTGPYAGLLRNLPSVIQAAFEEAGQIHGRRLIMKTYDDGTANASTIQAEEKRARNESFALLSGVGETNVVLAPLADQHKIPLIVANIDEQVALPLKTVFAVTAYWRRQAMILPSFIKNQLGGAGKRIGIVYEGTSTAKNAKEAFKVKAHELGLDVVFEQPIAQNQSACANEVANLKSQRVEIVFMLNGPLGATCMLRDARALGYKPTWTGVGLSWNFNVVATASGGAADGARTLATGATLDSPAGRRFVAFARKYMANSGAEEDDLLLLGYGFTLSFIEGVRRAGPNLSRESFVQTFETQMNNYDEGFFPPPTFGPGNRSGPTAVGVTACCTNGRWTTPHPGWKAAF
jgi:branched-chain amino acid transport system substrate-binding protein